MGIVILQLGGTSVSYAHLGFLEAFKDLPIAFISFFAANFINRFGTKKSLALALSIVAICCFALPFVAQFWFFKLWFALIGICFSVAKISVYGILRNNITSETSLAKVMNNVEASFMIGIFIVNIGFGTLISSSYSEYWKFGFLGIALLSAINVFLLLRTEIKEFKIPKQNGWGITLKSFVAPQYFVFLLIIFSIVFIEQNFNSWLPSFYKNHLGFNSFWALQAPAFMALCSFLGRITTSKIIQRYSIKKYYLTCIVAVFSILALAQLMFQNGLNNISFFIFPLVGFFFAPLYPVISSQMIAQIEKSSINIFTSLIVIFSSLGSSFGSIIMSYIFELNYGSYYAVFISFALIILFFLSFIYFRSYVSKKENNF